MKTFIRVLEGLLILFVIYAALSYTPNTQKLEIDTKVFDSYTIYEEPEVEVEEKKEQKNTTTAKTETKAKIQTETVAEPKTETTSEPVVPSQSPITDYTVIETFVGTMTAYGPDCVGCSGKTASGFNARSTIYYSDEDYGSVRIVAGDRKYPFGTIVRITGLSETVYAIVLDRGGAIGIEKKIQFDLLYASESAASTFGIKKNLTFEIVRSGY